MISAAANAAVAVAENFVPNIGGQLSSSLCHRDSSEVLKAVIVSQVVDEFSQPDSHVTTRCVCGGRALAVVELDGDHVMAHSRPPQRR
jgi:hypothetical protein